MVIDSILWAFKDDLDSGSMTFIATTTTICANALIVWVTLTKLLHTLRNMEQHKDLKDKWTPL